MPRATNSRHPSSFSCASLLDRAFVDTHDGTQEFERVLFFTLERVAAHDRAEAAAIADRAHFVEDLLISGCRASGEDDDAATSEGTLNHVLDTLGQGRNRDLVFLVNLLSLGQFDLR